MEQPTVEIDNPASNEKSESSVPVMNLNMEVENTETVNSEERKPMLHSDDLNEESDSESDHNDIDIDIGEEGPAVDHPLLDIGKDYDDEDEEIDFSDEVDRSDEPIDIDSPSPTKPIEQTTIKLEPHNDEEDEEIEVKEEEEEEHEDDYEDQKRDQQQEPPKEISEKLARAQSDFLDILKTLSASDMHTYFSWIDTTLKPHNLSIFGEPKRGPGRRKGVKKQRPAASPAVISDRRPPNRQQNRVPKDLPPKRRISSMPTTTRQLLCSPDSRLVHVNMRDVINWKSFQTLLTPEEKDKLLRYLPPIDKQSLETLQDMFNSNAFHSHLLYFQDMLEAGEFDKNNDDYKQYLIGKKKREQPVEEWKAKYYEEYWGQKKKASVEETPLPVYSFTEEAKLSKPLEDAKVEALHSIDDILADFGAEVVEEEETFEEPLEMLDDDFDDYSEEEAPKKKRKYKRKKESDEEKPTKPSRRSIDKPRRKKSSDGANSFRRCAHTILKREGRPLSAAEIVKIGIKEGMISTSGKTPQNTLASVLYCEMKKDPRCVFVKVAPMTFGLRTWNNGESYGDVSEPVKTRNNPKRRKKKQVEEEESEESESDLTPSEDEESGEQTNQGEQPIIINLSAVPPAEK